MPTRCRPDRRSTTRSRGYHFGSARLVKVTYVSTTGKFTAQSGYQFTANDVGHTVTASGIDQTCLKLPPAPSPVGTALYATAETASPNTLTVNATTGSVSTAAAGAKTITMVRELGRRGDPVGYRHVQLV